MYLCPNCVHTIHPYRHNAFLAAVGEMHLMNPLLGNCKRLLLQKVAHDIEELAITTEKETLGGSDIIPNPFCPSEWH